MAIESLKANRGILLKVLSKVTKKDYYKTPTGTFIKTDKGKGSVSFNGETGEITCDGLQNAIVKGTAQNDKISIVNSSNVKVYGGNGDDELTLKYSDTVEIKGGKGNDAINTVGSSNFSIEGGEGTDNINIDSSESFVIADNNTSKTHSVAKSSSTKNNEEKDNINITNSKKL